MDLVRFGLKKCSGDHILIKKISINKDLENILIRFFLIYLFILKGYYPSINENKPHKYVYLWSVQICYKLVVTTTYKSTYVVVLID
jgi:hypothetical protein